MRLKLGPGFHRLFRALVPAPGPLLDPDFMVIRVDDQVEPIVVHGEILPYSLDTHTSLVRVWVVVVPVGDPFPLTAEAFLDSSYPTASIDVTGVLGGAVSLSLGGLPRGIDVLGQVILGFDD